MFRKTLTELCSSIRSGETQAVDVAEYLLERIEKYDNKVKSYTTLNPEAIGIAERYDVMLKQGEYAGELHGVPLSVKDLIDTAGIRTTYGNKMYESYVPKSNAKVIDNLLSSGSYVLGKTNTHEFALGMVTPPTSNPYDLERIPGGSSGGSAAAVAAGMAIAALGSDTGGSIRIPSAMCGVTGLKPTYGMVSNEGVFPEAWSLDHVGPILRFASDIPLVMRNLGYDIGYRKSRKEIRAGIITENFGKSSHKVSNSVRGAISLLEGEDILRVSEFSTSALEDASRLHPVIDTSEIATVHSNRYRDHPEIFMKTSVEQILAGTKASAVDYITALRSREEIYRRLLVDMKGLDVLISPTLPHIAPTKKSIEESGSDNATSYDGFQMEFDYLGVPALSVPCGFADGMPVGMQIISRRMEDITAVQVGTEYQNLTDFHLKCPME